MRARLRLNGCQYFNVSTCQSADSEFHYVCVVKGEESLFSVDIISSLECNSFGFFLSPKIEFLVTFSYLEFLVTFSLVMVEKILFWGQIFEMEILMDLHVMRSPESENHFYAFGLSLSVCVCVCLLSA